MITDRVLIKLKGKHEDKSEGMPIVSDFRIRKIRNIGLECYHWEHVSGGQFLALIKQYQD